MALSYKATLFDLIQTVSEFAATDDEILATVTHLINSGKVRLGGSFTGARIDFSPRARLASPLLHITTARP